MSAPATSLRPSPAMLAWIQSTIGADAHVTGCRRLTGGLTSLVQRLTVEHQGRRRSYVLRRWPSDSPPGPWIIKAVNSETAVLNALEHSGLPAPRVLGATTDVAHDGPAVLMTCLPGRVHLAPRDREQWLRQMAATLTRIHDISVSALGAQPNTFEPWLDRSQLAPPPGASRPDIWGEAIALLSHDRPVVDPRFIHRDYQHFNVLWSRERLTGVVDWGGACVGPPDVDVGHCRINLALLFSAEIADRFLTLYEAESGRRVDRWWDLHELLAFGPDWKHFLPMQIGGRAPLDVDGMPRRLEAVIEGTLRRL